MRVVMHMWGAESIWESLYLLLSFVHLKLSFKKSLKKGKQSKNPKPLTSTQLFRYLLKVYIRRTNLCRKIWGLAMKRVTHKLDGEL